MKQDCSFSQLVLVLLFQYTIAMNFTNLSTDQSSLLILKSHITSDPYNVLTNNWTTKTSVCSWTGVLCGVRHNRVTRLAIQNMGLEGTIPPEIGNLSFLVSLNLNGNLFHGNIPKEIGNLARLKELDLRLNTIDGELPPSLGQCSKLEHLLLSYNSFLGQIPGEIGNLTQLEELDLANNYLNGMESLVMLFCVNDMIT